MAAGLYSQAFLSEKIMRGNNLLISIQTAELIALARPSSAFLDSTASFQATVRQHEFSTIARISREPIRVCSHLKYISNDIQHILLRVQDLLLHEQIRNKHIGKGVRTKIKHCARQCVTA